MAQLRRRSKSKTQSLRRRDRRFRAQFERLEARQLLAAEIEPNGTFASGTTLPDNEILQGNISSPADVDYFRANLDVGERFHVNTFNVNAPPFSPTLPPRLEVFDASGNRVVESSDGRPIDFVAGVSGNYGIRISSASEFGTFVGDYAMQSTITPAGTDVESEPNSLADAPDVPRVGRPLIGQISSIGDFDRFRVDTEIGDLVTVSFAGLPEFAPTVRVTNSVGGNLGEDSSGVGLVAESLGGGNVFVELGPNVTNGPSEYAVIIDVISDSALSPDASDEFESAFDFPSTQRTESLVGIIDRMSDRDFYRFDINEIESLDFDIESSNNQSVAATGKELRLYDSAGRLLDYSTNGSLDTNRPDALTPGTYFIEVLPTSNAGLGPYTLSYTSNPLSLQRDNTLHFADFDGADPYLNFDRVAAYSDPAAIDFLIGLMDAKFGVYEVDVTQSRPVDGVERVGSGVGDFGDIGAAGFGNAATGTRSNRGDAVNDLRNPQVDSLGPHGAETINQGFGHAIGLPTARDPQALMSFLGTTSLLPVGDTFAFLDNDDRRPGTSVYDARNYLDWIMQPGAQVVEPTRLVDNIGNELPTDLMPYLHEMSIDHQPVQSLDTGESPFYTATGDFNGDGRTDVAVASALTNTIEVYITTANGVLGPSVTVPAGGDIAVWTDAIDVGDFDGDGRDDLAVISFNDRRLTVIRSNGDGTFANGVNHTVAREPQDVVSADIDNDDDLDLVVVGAVNQQATVFANSGNGTFSEIGTFQVGSNSHSIVAADVNNDDNIDFITANSTSDTVTVSLGNGRSAFTLNSTLNVGDAPQAVAAADFNSDGADDIAVLNRTDRSVDVWLGLADGSFVFEKSYNIPIDATNMHLGDLDGDGNSDLIIGGFGFAAQLMLGRADGTFSRPISLEAGSSEASASIADIDGDGDNEIVIASRDSNRVSVLDETTDNTLNDRVTVFGTLIGSVDGTATPDLYSINVQAGERYTFDIDAAEFQYPLDSVLSVRDAGGRVLASSDDALDRNSGIASVDPFVDITFQNAGPITIEVSSKLASSGDYRLKVTPERALETEGPRVIASLPDNGQSINSTSQLVFFFDDVLDPATLTAQNIVVTGAASGVISGTATFNPFDSTLIWTADTRLSVDSYSVTLNGGADGIADLRGNLLDGEIASGFQFPDVSGNGVNGGSYMTTFNVTASDTVPAVLTNVLYSRDPYNRGRFQLDFSDTLSSSEVYAADYTLRGAGADQTFGTPDDTIQSLDPVYDNISNVNRGTLYLYSRGIPDSDIYRIEGSAVDGSGYRISLSETVAVGQVVPSSALFTDQNLTNSGVTGSYVDSSLRGVSVSDDWRTSQTIAGTRVDSQLHFGPGEFGDRATVGVTSGADNFNWDDFSVQWDGWVTVPDSARLMTRSNDGSRLWVDINRDGAFDASELVDNGWGSFLGTSVGDFSPSLTAGSYEFRVQFENGVGPETLNLEWVLPGRVIDSDGLRHGPSVTDVSISDGTQIFANSPDMIAATFSASIDPSTLDTSTVRLRRSDNATFFDADDELINDIDGTIGWDPLSNQASMNFAEPLRNGFYLFELIGEPGGIANPAGDLLDGEFLTSIVHGNSDPFIWENTPSGNGIPGGTFRSTFVVSQPELSINIEQPEISEFGGQTVATISRRFSPLTSQLTVALNVFDPTELSTVDSVIIPRGQESVTVALLAVDDSLIDGTQTVLIEATAAGITGSTATIDVADYETLELSLRSNSISELDGSTELFITRTDARRPLTAFLSTDLSSKLFVPAQVFFAPGQSSIRVPITAIDNALFDGDQTATITVESNVTVERSTSLTVIDHEELILDIVDDEISENGGIASGTVTRTDPDGRMTVSLSVDVPGQLSVPSFVQFADGQLTSNAFEIRAVDNQLFDSTRTVVVTASADGHVSASDSLDVTDFEELQLRISESSVSEFEGRTTARVFRTDPTSALPVQLVVDDDSQVAIPSGLLIPAGELASQPFEIRAIDNAVEDGARTITITAMATGHVDSVNTLTITDFEQLELSTDAATYNEDDGTVTFTLSRPAPGPASIVSLVGADRRVVQVPPVVTIPSGVTSITVIGDLIDDAVVGEDAIVTVSAISTDLEPAQTTFAVAENDNPQLTFAFETTNVRENGETLTGRISRNTRNGVVVRLSALTPDQIELPSSIFFTPGRAFAEFEITTINNNVVDGIRDVSILASAEGHPDEQLTIRINDEDQPGFLISGTSETLTVAESGDAAIFDVVLDSAPVSDVTLKLESSNANQVAVSPATLTFTPENWSRPQSASIEAIDDDVVEPQTSYDITLSIDVESSNEAFGSLDVSQFPVTVDDNDVAGIALETTGDSTIVYETGETDDFFVRLTSRPQFPVTLVIDNSELPQVFASPSTVTFTAQNWDQNQQIVVSTPLDFQIDRNQIGRLNIRVDDSTTSEGYRDLRERTLAAVHVDSGVGSIDDIDTEGGATIRRIDLKSNGPQQLLLTSEIVTRVTSPDNSLEVLADEMDTVIFDGNWVLTDPQTVDGIAMHRLIQGNAVVRFANVNPWQNPLFRHDVNRSRNVSPADALSIINRIDAFGFGDLPTTYQLEDDLYYDVNGDGAVRPSDALEVINFIATVGQTSAAAELVSWGDFLAKTNDDDATPATTEPERLLEQQPQTAQWNSGEVDHAIAEWLDEIESEDSKDEPIATSGIDAALKSLL